MDKEYWRRKIKGALLGKTVGETIGRPHMGAHDAMSLEFYDPLPPPNSSCCFLDFQLVWLTKLSQLPHPVAERDFFAQCWLDHIRFYDAEYGLALRNLKNSIMPPWSGSFDNFFSDNFGAAKRADIWAFLAPAKPDLAKKAAYEDACVDHDSDGIYAAEFFAVLLSAAFIENDLDTLLNTALEAIPPESRLAEVVRETRALCAKEKDWKEVRKTLLSKYACENYEDSVMNTGFILTALLLGKGDFETSLLIAVNCARNTSGNAGMVGELLGLLEPETIPPRYLEPVTEQIGSNDPESTLNYPLNFDAFIEALIELAGRLEIHTPPVCDEPDWNHFLIPVECGIFRNWNRWNETLPETTDLPLKTQYTFPGCFNYLDTFEVPANSLYMMRFRFTIEEPKMVRVIFNCNAVSRVWVDGVFQFGRDGGWMVPSYDTVPLNQFCDMELDAGIHELVAGVAPGSPEENIYWVMGVANCSDCQWLPYAFFNSIDE